MLITVWLLVDRFIIDLENRGGITQGSTQFNSQGQSLIFWIFISVPSKTGNIQDHPGPQFYGYMDYRKDLL